MIVGEDLTSVVNSTVSDRIYSILQEWIFTRQLPMGERLDFGELERKLGVSRTPLHEAVGRLESDGLITSVPRKGKYVATFRQDDVRERFEIRRILEVGTVEEIVEKLTPEQCDRIEGLCKRMREHHAQNGPSADYIQFVKLDAEFHRQILSIAGGELLLDMYNSLLLHLRLASIFITLKEKRIRASIEEHEEIVASLKARDANRLKRACITHLTNSTQEILDRMQALGHAVENQAAP